METNKMDVVKMLSRQNNRKYKISEKYSVGFYTDSMLGRLSGDELKKLFKFETKKKERYKKYQVYGM